MKLKPIKLAPALIAACVIALTCLVRISNLEIFERLERMSYDWRARLALRFPTQAASNLGVVYIDNASIAYVKTNHVPGDPRTAELGYRFGLYWPRQVYGHLIEELSAQGAKTVGLDVIFGETRPDHPAVEMLNGKLMESDDYFGLQMRRAGNVILAATKDIQPPRLFSTNALAVADISTDKDGDGILRRVKAFRTYQKWHFAFETVAADPELGVDLSKARVETNRVVLPRSNGEVIEIPLDANGEFALSDFFGDKLPANIPPKAKPMTDTRLWHMGVVLAAQQLGLDLNKAEVNLGAGKIVLHGTNGIMRVIPVDHDGYFYVDWCLRPNDPRLTQESIQNLLLQNRHRLDHLTNGLVNEFKGKLVVVGSIATGNDLRDEGATPLDPTTFLVSKHWNVANTVLTGHFIRHSSVQLDLLIIAVIGILTGWIVWELRVIPAAGSVMLLMVAYVAVTVDLYMEHRLWLPLALPLVGGFVMMYAMMTAWRVIFEQADKRRVKSIFSRVVAPNVMQELLQAETLALGGARREVTILFADVRGFTEFTDRSQDAALAYIAENKLSKEATEAFFDEQARETLHTVNTYLALVADEVKRYDGTLDKYIGDCVMAFWGAPTPNPRQALCCVRAAIDAQRAVYDLNKKRVEENDKRELENMTRISAGLTPKPMLPILLLGTGINTGLATAGLMGSQQHQLNYTVFGREVNLASRLETLSGRGRILISEATYKCLQRDEPALAATCTVLPELQKLKGFGAAVKVYEVPWRQPGADPFDEEFATRIFTTPSASTNVLKRENL